MVKLGWTLGWVLTAYLGLSFILFFAASNTLLGGIIYLFLLLPFYGLLLIGWWLWVWKYRTRSVRIRYRIWSLILALQVASLLVSPGNCFRVKEGARCYSNLQILLGNVPRTGPSNAPHWTLVEDVFLGFLGAYAVALLMGLSSIAKSAITIPDEP